MSKKKDPIENRIHEQRKEEEEDGGKKLQQLTPEWHKWYTYIFLHTFKIQKANITKNNDDTDRSYKVTDMTTSDDDDGQSNNNNVYIFLCLLWAWHRTHFCSYFLSVGFFFRAFYIF